MRLALLLPAAALAVSVPTSPAVLAAGSATASCTE